MPCSRKRAVAVALWRGSSTNNRTVTAGSRARTAAKGAAFDDPDIDMSMFRFWIPPRAFKGEVFLRTLDLPTIESFKN